VSETETLSDQKQANEVNRVLGSSTLSSEKTEESVANAAPPEEIPLQMACVGRFILDRKLPRVNW
jgi:hypothetical protein